MHNFIQFVSYIAIRSHLILIDINKMYVISFCYQSPLVAFSCYTVNIHWEKWLMRCDTKRAIWWNLYNKHISIFCIEYMSTFFARCRITNDSRKTKRFSPFARYMLINLVPKLNFVWIVSCSWNNHIILLMLEAENVQLLWHWLMYTCMNNIHSKAFIYQTSIVQILVNTT